MLQRLLDATDGLLSREQSRERLRRLNSSTEHMLDTEWEVALLFGLSQIGAVSYEPALGGSSRPDVHFQAVDVDFVVDVATVNDSGYEDANRRLQFEREFWKRVRRKGLPPAGFGYRIEGEPREGKMRLLLPDSWELLFDNNFDNFLERVRLRPPQQIGLHRKDPGVDVTFWFMPGQDSVSSGYPGYRYSAKETQTPIFNALKRKREQLKRSGYAGTMGVVLCDGDSQELRSPVRILNQFFRSTTSIRFVVVVLLDGDRFSRTKKPIRLSCRYYANPRNSPANSDLIKRIFERDLAQAVPPAYDDVVNALNHLRWKNRRVGLSHHGGYSFWGDGMQISGRVLLELLGGAMSFEDFMKAHRFANDASPPGHLANPFALALQQGRMIANVTVERDEADDDDWITFEFTKPDPAISKFRSPLTEQQ